MSNTAHLLFGILLFYQKSICAVEQGTLQFIEEPHDAVITVGQSTIFYCRTVPKIDATHQFIWHQNNTRLRKDDSALASGRIRVLGDGGTIYIRGALTEDSGLYHCEVETLEGAPVLRSRKAKLVVVQRREKPRISHRPIYTEVTTGEVIRLHCGASGFPKPTFAWYKDGGRLSNAHDRFEVTSDGTLVISNAQLEDSAHYRCSASNYLGRAGSAAKVKVNPNTPEAPPEFTSRPRSVQSQAGSIVEFTCVARGQPYPDLSWWNNNRIVNSDGRKSVSNGGNYLRIVDVHPRDSGVYVCRAQNRLGRKEVSARLSVVSHTRENGRLSESSNGPTALASIAAPAALQRSLQFIVKPHDLRAVKGATVQLPCRAEGKPHPAISWVKDTETLLVSSNENYRISPYGHLVVYNVSEVDAGTYKCVATSGEDVIDASAVISIRGHISSSSPSLRKVTSDPLSSKLAESKKDMKLNAGMSIFPDENATATTYYDPHPLAIGDDYVLVSLEEASAEVDKAINQTLSALFDDSLKDFARNSTPAELLRVFRYPAADARAAGRAAEIYQRTLELVAAKVRQVGAAPKTRTDKAKFEYQDLVSRENLELIANVSGCEAHRARREVNCTADLCFHRKYRSLDGSCNNLANPLWGSSLTAFKRILPPEYEDGFNQPIGWNDTMLYHGFPKPSSRLVSSLLISSGKTGSDRELSHMAMQWGQFLDHDVDHSMEAISREAFENGVTCGLNCDKKAPCFPIKIPPGDPRVATERCIEFTRSSAACGSGATSVFFDRIQPREQVNQLTAYIDASQVYGSQLDLSISLRNLTNDYGRLREGPSMGYSKPLLPFNDGLPIDCRRDPTESNIGCFLAGDVRANEQVGLLSMHVIFFREHNRLVESLRGLNPHWDGDRLYHEARKIVGAQMQHITYKHWLPRILGPEGMSLLGEYNGYNPDVDSTVSNVFASSAFRFGHTMVNPMLKRLDASFRTIPAGDLPLGKAFFAPWRLVEEGGVDPILRGLFASPAKEVKPEEVMSMELTEKLFQVAHAVALDLGALNVQRGRDHGLPSYAAWRKHCGFGATRSWDDFAMDIPEKVRLKLAAVYGHPKNVDAWVGGLLEKVVPGGRVGRTVRCLLVEQFKRLRDGDRFWYENPSTFTPEQLREIRQVTLGHILCHNGDQIDRVTADVFRKPDKEQDLVDCANLSKVALHHWFECNEDSHSVSPFNSLFRSKRDLSERITDISEENLDRRLSWLTRELNEVKRTLQSLRRDSESGKNVLN